MISICNIVFILLCLLFVGFGQIVGWTYEETCVYLCINFLPKFLVLLFAVPTIIGAIKLFQSSKSKKLWRTIALSIIVLFGAYMTQFLSELSFAITTHYNQCSDIFQQYTQSVQDLVQTAKLTQTTYVKLNLIVFCEFCLIALFFSIFMNFLIIRISKATNYWKSIKYCIIGFGILGTILIPVSLWKAVDYLNENPNITFNGIPMQVCLEKYLP